MRVVITQDCPHGKAGSMVDVPQPLAESMVRAGVARLPSMKDLAHRNCIATKTKLKGGNG